MSLNISNLMRFIVWAIEFEMEGGVRNMLIQEVGVKYV